MKITSFTIARLYNLGNYEHVRYELTVAVPNGESVEAAFVQTLKILRAANPKPPCHQHELLSARNLVSKAENLAEGEKLDEWEERGLPAAQELIVEYKKWQTMKELAIKRLDDLGGISVHTDAKKDWDEYDYADFDQD